MKKAFQIQAHFSLFNSSEINLISHFILSLVGESGLWNELNAFTWETDECLKETFFFTSLYDIWFKRIVIIQKSMAR